MTAVKRVTLMHVADTRLGVVLARKAWRLAAAGRRQVRCLVFADSRSVVEEARREVCALAKTAHVAIDTELLVGGRRVFEREAAARCLRRMGFLAGSGVERTQPSFVFATAAGEVGVDLDADHMVADVVPWERMVQRLGRVNRRGDGAAEIVLVTQPSADAERARKKPPEKWTASDRDAVAEDNRLRAVRELIDRLSARGDARDASPAALREVRLSSRSDSMLQRLIEAATTPPPLRPALSRALVDAWSMTSLDEHTGRPDIAPWLRGWLDEIPQTTVVWRTHLPFGPDTALVSKQIEEFFEAAPPHTSEQLETETFRVLDWLSARALRLRRAVSTKAVSAVDDRTIVAVLLTPAGKLRRWMMLGDLDLASITDATLKRNKRDEMQRLLANTTLIVDARLGGLAVGLLDVDAEYLPADHVPRTADDGLPWVAESTDDDPHAGVSLVRFRVRLAEEVRAGAHDGWYPAFWMVAQVSEEGTPIRYLVVDNAVNEERRSTGRPQTLEEHQAWAERQVRELAVRLAVPDVHAAALTRAARVHDEGKRAARWQRAFAAPAGACYAKTRGPVNTQVLGGYRHELGSLIASLRDPQWTDVPEDLRDLAYHAIAAHHGFARPAIGVGGCDDAPPSALGQLAADIAVRFARLQRRWGPWGLAWWELLLRAADHRASRKNDDAAPQPFSRKAV